MVESLAQYEVQAERAGVRPNKTATSELRERLRYLDITLEMIRKATGQLEETMRAGLPARDALELFEQSDRARILTETFYFNTGRIGQLLKHPSWMPHVGDPGFIGAFMVRHKLVEHYDAEGSDYEQGPSFGLGGSNGPTLQPGMSREWTDAGLYANARGSLMCSSAG